MSLRINVGELLSHRAMLSPNKVGLVCEGREYTYIELNRRANKAGHAMESLGVRPGDRVAILAVNGVEYYDLFFGLAKTGVILVPLNHRLAAAELATLIRDSGPRVLVYSPQFEGLVEDLKELTPPFAALRTGGGGGPSVSYEDRLVESNMREPMIEAVNDDELAIIYAFWAMGKPRGIMLSHDNFFWVSISTMSTLTRLGQNPLLALPLYHIGGLSWLPTHVHLGKKCVLMPGFEAEEFLYILAKQEITTFGAVPTMLHFLKEAENFKRTDFSKVRCLLSYGQALPVSLVEEYAGKGIRIRNLYGLTETTGPALVIDAESAVKKAGSCGLPFFHTAARLVDDLGHDLPANNTGEIVIKGEHVMKGYWNAPEATADTVRDGWLYTGDLARKDEDGYFFIVDRKKEMVISGGENINPGQVEGVLFDHPAVADVAVFGEPDPVWGESIMATVVKREGRDATADELKEWCKDKIAAYKIPRDIRFIDDLPRTPAGKMEKKKLRGA